MKRFSFTLLILIALLVVTFSMAAAAKSTPVDEVNLDVIILSDRNTDDLVDFIQSVGGTVKFQYQNVPAVAAAVPSSKLDVVTGFKGVLKVEKDLMFHLDDDLDGGKNGDHPRSYIAEDTAGVAVEALDFANVDPAVLPDGYANFIYTGALFAWGDTYAGEGSIVAIVDTGTVPNTCIGSAVIGAPGYPDGYNATDDGVPATDPGNHWHGTHVGGVIASSCSLDFSANPTHPIYLAQVPYLGWPVDSVPIFGQAPEADLYPVKVFPQDGGGSPTSTILDGLDHVLTLKNDGVLDIDVVNMSLGGPTLWDGRDVFDRFVEELQAADILVVTSASNDGPRPNSVGSPATSFSAISVGALDYAPSSRTFYEYLGLAVWPGAPGQGLVMRPTAETRVVNYSSRGPLSDGRMGPEIVALGHWNFHEGPVGELRWAGGTSFSSPTVAGAAALLNAYWEGMGYETDPVALENVLSLGADPDVVAPIWQGINDQGYGTLDVPASLEILMSGDWKDVNQKKKVGELTANILGEPEEGETKSWESDEITLDPSEPFDLVLEIGKFTSEVTIEVFDIQIPDNWDYAYWANALEVHLEGGKRTSTGEGTVSVLWYPWYGDSFDIVVEDGPWTFWGLPWDDMPMEPGLMRLSLIGDYSNESQVSFKVRITREDNREPLKTRVASGVIKTGDFILVPVEVPEGTSLATFDLTWGRDWSKFPTSDLDMLILDPGFNLVSFDGATMNAPERAAILDPAAGTYYVFIDAYELYKPDNYNLYLTLE